MLYLPKYKLIESLSHQIPGCISFSQGAVKMGGTPLLIKEHIRMQLQSERMDFYQYVGGILPLREKIAANLSQKTETLISCDNIMMTHGAIGGITALCLALLNSGDEVIIPEPAYPSYRNIVLFSKATPVYVQAYYNQENEWKFDLNSIQKATSPRTKMVIISHPSNPTGKLLNYRELAALKKWCESRSIYLVSDEVYDNYIYDGDFYSCTSWAAQSEYVIRTGSFSKDYSMSGWRIGFVVAHKNLISKFVAVQDGTLCCPSVVGQYAALFALNHPELITDQVNAVKNNRNLSYSLLQPLMDKGIVSCIKPNAGIFLFLKTTVRDSEPLVMEILNKAHVALVPGIDFGPSPEAQASIRLCFAREEAILCEGIQRLLAYFK